MSLNDRPNSPALPPLAPTLSLLHAPASLTSLMIRVARIGYFRPPFFRKGQHEGEAAQ